MHVGTHAHIHACNPSTSRMFNQARHLCVYAFDTSHDWRQLLHSLILQLEHAWFTTGYLLSTRFPRFVAAVSFCSDMWTRMQSCVYWKHFERLFLYTLRDPSFLMHTQKEEHKFLVWVSNKPLLKVNLSWAGRDYPSPPKFMSAVAPRRSDGLPSSTDVVFAFPPFWGGKLLQP